MYLFIHLFTISYEVCSDINIKTWKWKHVYNILTRPFQISFVKLYILVFRLFKRTSYGVYISQLIRFARASSNLNDFNYRNKALTAKLLRQGYRYFKLRKAFSKFYRRHSALLEKYSVSLKTLLQQGISEPEFYGDLVYRFRKIVGKSNFSEQFRKLISRYKRIGYISWILCGRLHAQLSTQSLLMARLHSLIARRRFGPQTQWRPLRKTLTSGLGLDDMSLAWPAVVQLLVFIYSGIQ